MSAGELRILHVITRLDRGGSATNTLLTVAGLPRPFRATLVYGRTRELPPLAREVADRVESLELPALVRSPSPFHDLRALLGLYRVIRRGAFDLVHTHTSKAGVLGRAAARLARVRRIVHTPHGHYFHGGYAGPAMIGLFVHLERWAATFTDRIVALTDQEARDHLRLGIGTPGQFVTIPSGVDLEPYEKPGEPAATVRAPLGLRQENDEVPERHLGREVWKTLENLQRLLVRLQDLVGITGHDPGPWVSDERELVVVG